MKQKLIGIMLGLVTITTIAIAWEVKPDCENVFLDPLKNSEEIVFESAWDIPTLVEVKVAEAKDSINVGYCTNFAVSELRVK